MAAPCAWHITCANEAEGRGRVRPVPMSRPGLSLMLERTGVTLEAAWKQWEREASLLLVLAGQDRTAIGIVAQLDELFEIDAQARKQGLSQGDRQLLRLEKSKPLLEQIKSQIQAARTSTSSTGATVHHVPSTHGGYHTVH